jgi:hypothetical protein
VYGASAPSRLLLADVAERQLAEILVFEQASRGGRNEVCPPSAASQSSSQRSAAGPIHPIAASPEWRPTLISGLCPYAHSWLLIARCAAIAA